MDNYSGDFDIEIRWNVIILKHRPSGDTYIWIAEKPDGVLRKVIEHGVVVEKEKK